MQDSMWEMRGLINTQLSTFSWYSVINNASFNSTNCHKESLTSVLPTYDIFVFGNVIIGNVVIPEFLHWEVEWNLAGRFWKGFPWANQAHPPLGTNKRCFRCVCPCYKGIAKLQHGRETGDLYRTVLSGRNRTIPLTYWGYTGHQSVTISLYLLMRSCRRHS